MYIMSFPGPTDMFDIIVIIYLYIYREREILISPYEASSFMMIIKLPSDGSDPV